MKHYLIFLVLGFIFFFIIGTCKSHAKPKPKTPFPILIQSPVNKTKFNEGEYIKLKAIQKQLIADSYMMDKLGIKSK